MVICTSIQSLQSNFLKINFGFRFHVSIVYVVTELQNVMTHNKQAKKNTKNGFFFKWQLVQQGYRPASVRYEAGRLLQCPDDRFAGAGVGVSFPADGCQFPGAGVWSAVNYFVQVPKPKKTGFFFKFLLFIGVLVFFFLSLFHSVLIVASFRSFFFGISSIFLSTKVYLVFQKQGSKWFSFPQFNCSFVFHSV